MTFEQLNFPQEQVELALAKQELARKQSELDRILRRTTLSTAAGAMLGITSQTPWAREQMAGAQSSLMHQGSQAFEAGGAPLIDASSNLNSQIDNYLNSDKRTLGGDLLAILGRASSGATGLLGIAAGGAAAVPYTGAAQIMGEVKSPDILKFVPLLSLIPGGIGLIKAVGKFREVKQAEAEVRRLEKVVAERAKEMQKSQETARSKVIPLAEAAPENQPEASAQGNVIPLFGDTPSAEPSQEAA